MIKKIALSILVAGVSSLTAWGQASDNFENSNPSNDYNDGIQYNDNGGSGFGALTYLEGTGGGLFNGTLSGARALGIFAGAGAGNTQALGRNVTSPVTQGIYSFDARFDVNNSVGTTGFNLKSALGTSFGGSELLFVGLTPGSGNNQLFINDGGGTHTLTLGTATELRGVNINFSISFNSLADTYSLTATILSGTSTGQSGTFAGILTDTNGATAGTGALAAVGFGNFNGGSANQNLVVDNLSITVVPEPSSLSLLGGPAILGAWFYLRRRRA